MRFKFMIWESFIQYVREILRDIRMPIRGSEMLVFRKIFRIYLTNDPLQVN